MKGITNVWEYKFVCFVKNVDYHKVMVHLPNKLAPVLGEW